MDDNDSVIKSAIQKPIRTVSEVQESMFDEVDDVFWHDMPECVNHDARPEKTITLQFMTFEDAKAFGDKIGQTITSSTDSLWYPYRKPLDPGRYFYSGPKTESKYPICIPSKGRHDTQTTGHRLDELGCKYKFFVESLEYENYVSLYGEYRVVRMPFDNLGQGSIPARNFILDWAKENNHNRHWVIDDNIKAFARLNCNRRIGVKGGGFFRSMEDFVDRFENIAMAGPHHVGFVNDKYMNSPYHLNSRVYSCILLDTNTGFRWRGRYNEDTDLSLRLLKAGYCTLLFKALLMSKGTTVGAKNAKPMKGGNTDNVYNTGDHRKAFAESLRDRHPDCVEVVWKFNRWHHQVDYSHFKTPLKMKPGLTIRQGINNYGMRLTESSEYE